MNLNVAGILIYLLFCGIVASNADRAVDCRKFVFAPLCRGVAAKRGTVGAGHSEQLLYLTEESFRHLLRNLNTAISLLGTADDEHNQTGEPTGESEADGPAKIYPPHRYNRFLRLMFENRSNSEKENFPSPEFDKL